MHAGDGTLLEKLEYELACIPFVKGETDAGVAAWRVAALGDFLSRHPTSQYAAEASWKKALLLVRAQQWTAARTLIEQLLASPPTGSGSSQAVPPTPR